jgi:hypothetical protein
MSPTATEPEAPSAAPDDIFAAEDVETPDKPPQMWEGWDGLAVTFFGILFPSLVITVSSIICFERIMRLAFKHPVETLAECAFVILVPIANYYAWQAIRNQDGRHPLRIGLLNGAAVTTSFAVAATVAASVFFDYPVTFLVLAMIAASAGIASLYIGIRLRNSAGTRQGRANRLLFSGLGVLLSIASLAACEAKGTAIRVAESMALSDVASERDQGLALLRQFDCEQDLRMQCADDRAAGVPGLFWRVSPERERELYFAVTGNPYGNSLTESVYSMSDDYLRRHVVGSSVKGLNLLRSQIAGYVNSETLTSTINWTFVFKNSTFQEQEARAEIAVPPGAVVSDLTLWKDGSQRPAMIGPTDRAQREQDRLNKYTWVDIGQVDPALLTDLGRGRALLKVSPIPAQGEMRVQVTFTERLKPMELTQASLMLPRFVDTNFALTGDYNLRLHSAEALSLPADIKSLHKQAAADGGSLLIGTLNEKDLNGGNLNILVKRQPTMGPFYVADTKSSYRGFIKETIKQVGTSAPEHLVVVVDNSQSMKSHVQELVDALSKMPSNIKTSILLPTDGQQMEAVDLEEGIALIKKAKFDGGKDNLQAVIKAAETAGETKHGAVLWVHGPQPSFNQEMYIMAPYIQRPNFYELALDDRWTDTNEFFKNHREIGPFVPVARAGRAMDDLHSFLAKWKPGGTEFVVQLDRTRDQPNCKEVIGVAADELVRLSSRDECYELLRHDRLAEAADLATSTRIVTPVTGAAVLHRTVARAPQSDAQQTAWQQGFTNGTVSSDEFARHQNESAPPLPGATNGSIGPQGLDATVISGINTAGTVRVNNLANLEALLNLIANCGALLGFVYGGFLILSAACNWTFGNEKVSQGMRYGMGAACLAGGFALPGFINWMVASARDANLFS